MLDTLLFPWTIAIPRMPADMIARHIVGKEKKTHIMKAVMEAMDFSKAWSQAINFALFTGFRMKWMSAQEARSYLANNDELIEMEGSFYGISEDLIILTGKTITRDAVMKAFWQAFSSAIHKVYEGTRESCAIAIKKAPTGPYPFSPPALVNRNKHYRDVFAVYHELAELTKGATMSSPTNPPALSGKLREALLNKTLPWPFSDFLRDFLRESTFGKMVPCDHAGWNSSQIDECLVLTTIRNIISQCQDVAKLRSISEDGTSFHLNITNPYFFMQLPKPIAEILKAVKESSTKALTLPEEARLLGEILKTNKDGQALNKKLFHIHKCTRDAIIGCDAILGAHFPFLSPLSSMQTLMAAHKEEIYKAVECNPGWAKKFDENVATIAENANVLAARAKVRGVQLGGGRSIHWGTLEELTEAGYNISKPSAWDTGFMYIATGVVFAAITTGLKRSVALSTYQNLTWVVGKPLKLMSYWNIAHHFASLAHAPFIGPISCVMDEALLYLSDKHGISAVPRMISNAISLAGVVYMGYQNPETFAIAVTSGVGGQLLIKGIEYAYDRYYSHHREGQGRGAVQARRPEGQPREQHWPVDRREREESRDNGGMNVQ